MPSARGAPVDKLLSPSVSWASSAGSPGHRRTRGQGTGGRACGDGHVSSVGLELGRRPWVFPSSRAACRQQRPRSGETAASWPLSLVAMARGEQKARLAHAARGSPSPGRLSASSRRRGLGPGAGRPLPRLLRPGLASRPSSAQRGPWRAGLPSPPRPGRLSVRVSPREEPSLSLRAARDRAAQVR